MMNSYPAVSVVIPTFNRGKIIKNALDSLVYQTFKDFEVLIYDDGSSDNTNVIINNYLEFLDITYFWFPNSGGPALPRSFCIEKAIGKYIAFLDSDDLWYPRKLEICMNYLSKGFDLVYHDFDIICNKNFWRKKSFKSRQLSCPVFKDLLLNGNCIINSSVVVSKGAIECILPINQSKQIVAAEDYDTWLRFAKITDLFGYIPETLGLYSIGNDNISSKYKSIAFTNYFLSAYSSSFDNSIPYWISSTLARKYFEAHEFTLSAKWSLYQFTHAKDFSCLTFYFLLYILAIFCAIIGFLKSSTWQIYATYFAKL